MSRNRNKPSRSSVDKSAAELDAILLQALDDFDVQDIEKQSQAATQAIPDQPQTRNLAEDRLKSEDLDRMLASMNDPGYGTTLQSTLRTLSTTDEGNSNVEALFEQLQQQFAVEFKPGHVPAGPSDVDGIERADREITTTLQMLGDAQLGMEGFEPGKLEEAGETMMEDMMAQFEALGEKEDYNEVVDGVMRQLLSKDLMYEPTKLICQKFPEWLALHRPNLSEAEYTNYGKQYQSFQKLLAVYDIEPDNFARLMELMFDMQQYGQPPAEIIKDLAPGLKFDENGMPIMPNMGSGMLPEMPGAPGGALPDMAELAGNMANGQCCVM